MRAKRAKTALNLVLAPLACVVAVAITAPAAVAGNFTAVGGLTHTDVTGTGNGDFSSNGVGWFFGGLINLTHYLGTGFEAGLLFGQRKLTQSVAQGSNTPQTLNVSATYAEIPVEYLWRLSRLFFFDTGVYALHYLGGTYNAFASANPATPLSNSFTLSPDEFGALLGFGGEFPIGKQTAIRAETRYNEGIAPHKSQELNVIMGLSYHF